MMTQACILIGAWSLTYNPNHGPFIYTPITCLEGMYTSFEGKGPLSDPYSLILYQPAAYLVITVPHPDSGIETQGFQLL